MHLIDAGVDDDAFVRAVFFYCAAGLLPDFNKNPTHSATHYPGY